MNTEKEILNDNTLIAEFMGGVPTDEDHTEYCEDGSIKYTPDDAGGKWIIRTWSKPIGFPEIYGWGKYTMGEWMYHSSWDWLMPVMDKIESIDFSGRKPWTDIKTFLSAGGTYYECIIKVRTADGDGYLYENEHPWGDTKIEAVWQAVVRFIEWYNQQTK